MWFDVSIAPLCGPSDITTIIEFNKKNPDGLSHLFITFEFTEVCVCVWESV